jgi:hypothetical protein
MTMELPRTRQKGVVQEMIRVTPKICGEGHVEWNAGIDKATTVISAT